MAGMDPACEPYVSFLSWRRDGRPVATPVWIAAAGEHCYVFTASNAGKVKRLRHNPKIRLAPCTMRGEVRGPWREGHARLVDDPATLERAYAALRAKYGWQMWLTDLSSRLAGRYHRRAMIEITLDRI